MTDCRWTLLLARSMPGLAVAGMLAGTALAADLPVRPHLRSQIQSDPAAAPIAPIARKPVARLSRKAAGDATDITGSISWPASARAGLTPATAAISHAHTARVSFANARAAMDRSILLRDDAPKSNFAALETATAQVLSELRALEQMSQHRSNEALKKAIVLVEDWYEAGLKIIKPPAQGVTALPFPTTVATKAKAVSGALDRLIEETHAVAAPPGIARQRSEVQTRPPGPPSVQTAPAPASGR